MKSEAKIILPVLDNDGKPIAAARNAAIAAMVAAFGGLTSWDGRGHWANPQGKLFAERVTIHATAMENSPANVARLREIASAFARDAGQEAVYIVTPEGGAEFIGAGYTVPRVATA
jgi:hypothetical protein